MESMTVYCIPAIGLICYTVIELVKALTGHSEKMKNWYPLLSAFLGAGFGAAAFFFEPALISESFLSSVLFGMMSGLCATGGDQIVKRILAAFRDDSDENTEE